jgi:ribosomal-protein-alanine N-acetyltransferase
VALPIEPVCTDGVVALRVWEVEDARWYADSVQDPDIQRFTSDPPTLTADEVRNAIVNLRSADPPSDGSLPDVGLLICDAATGDRLGNIALAGRGCELSYWVAAPARRRGVATRAVRLLADYAFDILHADELRLWTHRDNIGSGAVAEGAGFVREPSEDRQRKVKGSMWDTRAYVRRANAAPTDRSARGEEITYLEEKHDMASPSSVLRTGQVLEISFASFTPRITIRSDRELTVEIIAGEGIGFSDTVEYEAVVVRDGLVLLSWQEHIGSTIVHVLDFISGNAHTAITPATGGFTRLTGRIGVKSQS